jgi:hypothetical protein
MQNQSCWSTVEKRGRIVGIVRPLHNRFCRVLTFAAMSASLVILGGGVLVTAAGPSSAATGGTNVCSSAVSSENFITGVGTERLSGCHQQGSATVVGIQQTPLSPTLDTIHWATGHATSHAIASAVVSFGAPCPAADITNRVTLRVTDGPYAGSTGHNVICSDLSQFPIINSMNLGPLTI